MKHLALFAQSFSATDSQNLQDIHDWISSSLSVTGFEWGLGSGIVFGASFLVWKYMRSIFKEVDGD